MADIYVKLGEKANSFSDPISGVNLSGKEVIILTDKARKSKKTDAAFKGGHLVRASRTEYEAYQKMDKASRAGAPASTVNEEVVKENLSLKEKNQALEAELAILKAKAEEASKVDDEDENLPHFDDMDDEELVNYYSENYQVTDKQIKEFSKLKKGDKVAELIKLEKPEDEE